MKQKAEEMVNYIQSRCLWQFFSRSWDREENIDGILTGTERIFCEEPPVLETDADRCWHADARILASDFRREFPWIKELTKEEIKIVLSAVKLRMKDIVITKSMNEELHVKFY
ncbi:MAG: Fe-only/vanadium nitrogenase subunit delta [Fibrobacterota bacterium]|nr:Fe-only/vanadium nitrogenase subunit delta [Chitinispirillaceae bacterium]